jgi:hypothetical protein
VLKERIERGLITNLLAHNSIFSFEGKIELNKVEYQMFCEQCVEGRTNRKGMNSKPFKVLRFAPVAFAFSELQPPKKKERKKERKENSGCNNHFLLD